MTRTAAPSRALTGHASASVTLWLLTLAVMSAFQFWRGAPIDGAVFAAVALGLVIERAVRMRRVTASALAPASVSAPRAPRLAIIVGAAIAAGLAIALGPRTGPMSILVVVALGVAAVALVWRREPEPSTRTAEARRRSRRAWATIAIALCLWEASAYVLSVTVPRGWIGFPTVSLLLEPVVDNGWTRAVLIAAWLSAGVWLVAGLPARRRMPPLTPRSREAVGS